MSSIPTLNKIIISIPNTYKKFTNETITSTPNPTNEQIRNLIVNLDNIYNRLLFSKKHIFVYDFLNSYKDELFLQNPTSDTEKVKLIHSINTLNLLIDFNNKYITNQYELYEDNGLAQDFITKLTTFYNLIFVSNSNRSLNSTKVSNDEYDTAYKLVNTSITNYTLTKKINNLFIEYNEITNDKKRKNLSSYMYYNDYDNNTSPTNNKSIDLLYDECKKITTITNDNNLMSLIVKINAIFTKFDEKKKFYKQTTPSAPTSIRAPNPISEKEKYYNIVLLINYLNTYKYYKLFMNNTKHVTDEPSQLIIKKNIDFILKLSDFFNNNSNNNIKLLKTNAFKNNIQQVSRMQSKYNNELNKFELLIHICKFPNIPLYKEDAITSLWDFNEVMTFLTGLTNKHYSSYIKNYEFLSSVNIDSILKKYLTKNNDVILNNVTNVYTYIFTVLFFNYIYLQDVLKKLNLKNTLTNKPFTKFFNRINESFKNMIKYINNFIEKEMELYIVDYKNYISNSGFETISLTTFIKDFDIKLNTIQNNSKINKNSTINAIKKGIIGTRIKTSIQSVINEYITNINKIKDDLTTTKPGVNKPNNGIKKINKNNVIKISSSTNKSLDISSLSTNILEYTFRFKSPSLNIIMQDIQNISKININLTRTQTSNTNGSNPNDIRKVQELLSSIVNNPKDEIIMTGGNKKIGGDKENLFTYKYPTLLGKYSPKTGSSNFTNIQNILKDFYTNFIKNPLDICNYYDSNKIAFDSLPSLFVNLNKEISSNTNSVQRNDNLIIPRDNLYRVFLIFVAIISNCNRYKTSGLVLNVPTKNLPSVILSNTSTPSDKKNIEARKYIYIVLRMIDDLIPNITRRALPKLVEEKKREINNLLAKEKINLSKIQLINIINKVLRKKN